MKIEKLLSQNVGTHHYEPAIIVTEQGELFVTKDANSPEGHELVPFLDVTKINTWINQMLRGHSLNGVAEVEIENGVIRISPIANCFRVVNYTSGSTITAIEGDTSGQPITIIGSGLPLNIQNNGVLKLISDMQFTNEVSTLFVQKNVGYWQELSRSNNT